jgi:hypothetical protein
MAALISPRDKRAPHFDGKDPKKLPDFLAEYELITAAAGVDGADRIQAVVNYVHRRVAELWSSFPTFTLDNWDNFKAELLKSYPEVKALNKYELGDLAHLSRKQFGRKMRTLDDLGKYHRRFIRIAAFLKTHKGATDDIINRYYIGGFGHKLRDKIDDHLEKLDPRRDITKIEGMTTVYAVAIRVVTKSTNKNREGRSHKSSKESSTDTSESSGSSDTDSSSLSSSASSDSTSSSVMDRKKRKEKEKTKKRKEKEEKSKKKERRRVRKEQQAALALSSTSTTSPTPAPPVVVKTEPAPDQNALMRELFNQFNQQSAEQARLLSHAINSFNQAVAVNAANAAAVAKVPRPYGCNFCGQPEHMMRDCLVMMKYLLEGKATKDSNGKLVTPSGVPIPAGSKGQPLQVRLDGWLAANPNVRVSTAVAGSTNMVIAPTVSAPTLSTPAAVHFYEAEFTALPSAETLQLEMGQNTEDEAIALVESWANEAKKTVRGRKNAKADVPVSNDPPKQAQAQPAATIPPPPNIPNTGKPAQAAAAVKAAPRARFVSQADDPALQEEIVKLVLNNKVDGGNITLKHLLAISPPLRSKLAEYLRAHRVEVPNPQLGGVQPTLHYEDDPNCPMSRELVVSESSVPLREVYCTVGGVMGEFAILDEGSSIIVIREDLWLETGLPIQKGLAMRMEGAHGDVASTLGAIVNLPIKIDSVTFYVRAQVVPRAPFRVLLGRPFFQMTRSTIENRDDHQTWLTVHNPNPPYESLTIPTTPRRPRGHQGCSHYFQRG